MSAGSSAPGPRAGPMIQVGRPRREYSGYMSRALFRVEVLDLLNQGEAVHSLQRAIHNGMITAKHGRTTEQLGAISGALREAAAGQEIRFDIRERTLDPAL